MAKVSSRRLKIVLDDDRIFTRLSSRQRCPSAKLGEASFRVLYYGGAAGSVPFLWESQPGTPKRTFRDSPLPPLTPPPSYQLSPRSSPAAATNAVRNSQFRNSKILTSIFPSKKTVSGSPPSPWSTSSFSSSSQSLPSTPYRTRTGDVVKPRSISRSGPDPRLSVEEYDDVEPGRGSSPTSTLCFGPSHRSPRRTVKGCYFIPIKKMMRSISWHGNKKN